jgi:hypothetical protein
LQKHYNYRKQNTQESRSFRLKLSTWYKNYCTHSVASEGWPKPGGKLPVKELELMFLARQKITFIYIKKERSGTA